MPSPAQPLPIQRSHTARVLARVAAECGAAIVFEPDVYNTGGYITFRNGKRIFFMNNQLGLNDPGACAVANDKDCAAFVLKHFGYRVPEGRLFRFDDAESRADARAYAQTLAWPLIVKPRALSKGQMVSKVHDRQEFDDALEQIFTAHSHAIVQRFYGGSDYRIVVFGDELIVAYLRTPPTVIGDGKATLAELVGAHQQLLQDQRRDARIRIDDEAVQVTLLRHGLHGDSVLAPGQSLALLPNANLSSGGMAQELTERIHPTYRELCIRICRDMGLTICGVDLLAHDVTAPVSDDHVILEINATPGLRHFASLGPDQDRKVHRLFGRILGMLEARR